MINSAFLLIIAGLVFVLGYRFYAKFLSAAVFRLDKEYSPSTSDTAPSPDTTHRLITFGHHVAMIAAATTLTGSAVALYWGWVPAFLWVVVGSVIAAGTYGLGAIWMGFQHRGFSLSGIVGERLGSGARVAFLLAALLVLLLLTALLALLAAQLLDLYPQVVLAFWVQFPIALALGIILSRGRSFEIVAGAVIGVLSIFVLLWIFKNSAISLGGALTFELGGVALLTLNNIVVWLVLVLALVYAGVRQPIARLSRPHGLLTAMHLAIGIVAVCVAIFWAHPPVVAPQFTATGTPGILPWVFVTVISGALAGFHLLIAYGISARQIRTETDARFVGYGGALAEGVVAVTVVLACAAGFGGYDEWSRAYTDWSGLQHLGQLTVFVIERWVYLASGLGIEPGWARMFFALLVLNLTIVTLEAGIRLQRNLLREINEVYGGQRLLRDRRPLILAVGLAGLVALYDLTGERAFSAVNGFWPVFGLANHLLAVLGLLLIAVLLARQSKPRGAVLLPMALLLALVFWAFALQVPLWWSQQRWGMLAVSALVAIPAIWMLAAGLRAVRPAAENTPQA